MKMKKTLIIGLLLAIILVAECVDRGTEQRVAPSGEEEQATIGEAQTAEENVLSVSNEGSLSGAPTGAYRVNLSLSDAPALNKPVKAAIDVYMPYTPFSNTTVSISLWEGVYFDERKLIFEEELWNGTLIGSRLDEKLGSGWEKEGRWIPPNLTGNYTVHLEYNLKINKTGKFTLIGKAKGSGSNEVSLYLNITERSAKVSKTPPPFVQPPPGPLSEYRPLDLKLEMAGIPKLNNTVELIATVISNVDENSLLIVPFDPKNTTFTIFLPEGFELVSGNLVWNGKLTTTKPILLRATVKAVKTGDWQISLVPLKEKPFAIGCAFNGYMDIRITEKEGWQRFGKGGCLFVRITNETGEVSELPLPYTPPPGATPPPKDLEMPPPTVSPTQLPLSTTLPPQTTSPPPGTPPLPLNATPSG